MKRKHRLVHTFLVFCLAFFFAATAWAFDYQWKFVISNMDDSKSAVAVFNLLHSIPSISDVEIDTLRQSATFYFEEDVTDEIEVKKRLGKAGFKVESMTLLQEPNTGIM